MANPKKEDLGGDPIRVMYALLNKMLPAFEQQAEQRKKESALRCKNLELQNKLLERNLKLGQVKGTKGH